jgi:hypothetical protein
MATEPTSPPAEKTPDDIAGTPVELIPISAIRIDGSTQSRAATSAATVAEYAEAIKEGAEFPPPVLYRDEDGNYWPGDGHHTILGYQRAGRDEVPSRVRSGTQRDAILHSVAANAKHGLKRSNADKRHAIEIMLDDPEWSQWTERQMAKACNVSHTLVANIKRERYSTTVDEQDADPGNIATPRSTTSIESQPRPEEIADHNKPDEANDPEDCDDERPEEQKTAPSAGEARVDDVGDEADDDEHDPAGEEDEELDSVAKALVLACSYLAHCSDTHWIRVIRFASDCDDYGKVRRAIAITAELTQLQSRYESLPKKTTQDARRIRRAIASAEEALARATAKEASERRITEWDRIVLLLRGTALPCAHISRKIYDDSSGKNYNGTRYILGCMAEHRLVRQNETRCWELTELGQERLSELATG